LLQQLVWLFAQHRALHEEVLGLRRTVQELDRIIQTQSHRIAAAPPPPPPTVEAIKMLDSYAREVLQEEPFKDGVIPGHLWLTPGEDDRPVGVPDARA
jgi:hypothetical protein